MTTDATLKYGQRVRFTSEQLGTIDPSSPGAKFRPEVVGKGDEGEVVTAEGQMPDGWFAIRPDRYPRSPRSRPSKHG